MPNPFSSQTESRELIGITPSTSIIAKNALNSLALNGFQLLSKVFLTPIMWFSYKRMHYIVVKKNKQTNQGMSNNYYYT